MIRAVLVDDDPLSRLAAKTVMEEIPDLRVIGEFGGSEDFFNGIGDLQADLVFLDIELAENKSGFSIASRIHRDYPELLFIFLTGHASYAIDGYGFHPVDFLTKPIRREKLEDAMKEVRKRLGLEKPQNIELLFHLNSGYRMINTADIDYIERRDRRNYMIVSGKELQISRYSMKELEDMLEGHGFLLCHQSFLVNIAKITFLGDGGHQLYYVTLKDIPQQIPVSRNKYAELLEALKKQASTLL